jgi:uncharacterized membrane protein
MKNLKLVLTFLFGAFMVLGGVNHFLKPEMYFPFFPDFLPKEIINYFTGIVEIALGIGTFIPSFRKMATLGILVLMLFFLPLHILDVFKESPAIGSHQASLIRLPIQFLFIAWAWYISRIK